MTDEVKDVEKKTAEVVAVPATAGEVVTGEKQGAKCFGCCCDYRRAVIISAGILIVLDLFGLVFGYLGVRAGYTIEAIDDESAAEREAILIASYILLGYSVVAIGFYTIELLGALKYNICMLYAAVVFLSIAYPTRIYTTIAFDYTITNTLELTFSIAINTIVTALLLYPLAGLIKEIKEGIMSPQTYPREEYSCCCMPNV